MKYNITAVLEKVWTNQRWFCGKNLKTNLDKFQKYLWMQQNSNIIKWSTDIIIINNLSKL